MSPTIIGIIGIVVLFSVLLSRMPVGLVLTLVGFLGFSSLVTLEAGVSLLGNQPFTIAADYGLTVVPLFVLMGQFAFYSGISERLYGAAHKVMGHFRGGLAMASIVACALFAAICGSSVATAATMGSVSLQEMKKYNYDPKLATGSVAAGGTLGILIPPSVAFIIYGIITEQSISKLFLAGIFPGVLLAVLFIITIYVITRFNPNLGPEAPRAKLKEMVISLHGIVEALALFALVMGGLFVGFFTPTEAGAIGALGALAIALARRRLSWQGFIAALNDTLRITAMIFVIIIGAMIFSRFLAVTQIPAVLAGVISGLPLPPLFIIAGIIIIFLLGGCFLDGPALILIFTPIFFPVVNALGINPIWFGVIVVIMTEMGLLTPPVGLNVYTISGVAKDVPLEDIFRAIFPFLIPMIVCVIILMFFPQIALFLPGLMG